MAAGVAHDRVRRVEAHRLGIEQCGGELRRIVQLHPRTGVHEVGEAHRVALRKAEAGEGLELVGDLLGHRAGDPVGGHALQKPAPQHRHPLPGPLGAHGLAELVGLAGGEVGGVDGHLHELLLEQRHPQCLLQARLEERVEVGDRLLAGPAAEVGVDGPALDRPGADQRHLDDDVVEGAGSQPGQRGHLGPALDLEHADGVGGAEQVVHPSSWGMVARSISTPRCSVMRSTARWSIVSIPRPRRSNFTRPAAAQSSLSHWRTERSSIVAHSTGQYSTRGRSAMTMPPEWMPRWRGKPCTCRARSSTSGGIPAPPSARGRVRSPPASFSASPHRPALDRLGHGVGRTRRQPGRLGHLPQRRAGPVGDDVGHLGGAVPAVAVVDVLDGLLPALVLDVEVDVGRPVPLRGEEPLEEEAEADGVGLGDAEGVADGGVGRRAPALAVEVLAAAELHEVVYQQEVAGEAQLLDEVEFTGDATPGFGMLRMGRGVAVIGARPGQLPQPAHLVVAGRDGKVRQVGGGHGQVEGAGPGDLDGTFDSAGPAGEAAVLLGGGTEVGAGRRREPPVEGVERPAGPDGGQGGGQRPLPRCGVVDVVGRHHPDTGPGGQRGQGVVAGPVERVPVVPQLDQHPLRAEGVDEATEGVLGGGRSMVDEGFGDGALAAAGEHEPGIVGGSRIRAEMDGGGGRLGQLRRGSSGGRPSHPASAPRWPPGRDGRSRCGPGRGRRGAHLRGRAVRRTGGPCRA